MLSRLLKKKTVGYDKISFVYYHIHIIVTIKWNTVALETNDGIHLTCTC